MLYLMRDACDLMLTPARIAAGAAKTGLREPVQPSRLHSKQPRHGGLVRVVRARHADLRQARLQPARVRAHRLGAPLLPRDRLRRALDQAEAADRGSDVGPLRDPSAGDRGGLPRHASGLHHRLGRRQAGAPLRRALRPRRLHRLLHRHVRGAGAGPARHGGLPALRAGAGRHRPDGSGGSPAGAPFSRADRWPHRHAALADRRQQAAAGAQHRLVRAALHPPRAVEPSGATGARSTLASSSWPGSSA